MNINERGKEFGYLLSSITYVHVIVCMCECVHGLIRADCLESTMSGFRDVFWASSESQKKKDSFHAICFV